jgi:dipeptidase D
VSNRTTLGADNGIGIAAALAVAEDADTPHGPLELLFTVDEEATVDGAKKLESSIVAYRRMLNLDAENDEELVVGCAGGADVDIEYGVRRTPVQEDGVAVVLQVRGLRGGHSGLSIHESRGNAIKILARVLRRWLRLAEVYIWSIEGGNKPTAIAREASALLLVPVKLVDRLRAIADQAAQAFLDELGDLDGGLEVTLDKAKCPDVPPMDCSSTRRLVRLLNALPHGVQAMTREEPQRVHTSANLAAVRTGVDRVTITMSARSMLAWGLDEMLNQIDATSCLAGAATEEIAVYPPWRAVEGSPMVALAHRIYGEVFSSEPRLSAIHAGAECGVIGQRVPDMDMVSFGPLIEDAHSPSERVSVASVQRFHLFLSRFLGALT